MRHQLRRAARLPRGLRGRGLGVAALQAGLRGAAPRQDEDLDGADRAGGHRVHGQPDPALLQDIHREPLLHQSALPSCIQPVVICPCLDIFYDKLHIYYPLYT